MLTDAEQLDDTTSWLIGQALSQPFTNGQAYQSTVGCKELKKKKKNIHKIQIVAPETPPSSAQEPVSSLSPRLGVDDVSSTEDALTQQVTLQLKEVLGMDMIIADVIPTYISESSNVLIRYGSCMYRIENEPLADIDVFLMSTKRFERLGVFEKLSQENLVVRIHDGSYRIGEGHEHMPSIDLHERRTTQTEEEFLTYVQETMSIHTTVLKMMQQNAFKKEKYWREKKEAKECSIYDSKYGMLKGVVIANMEDTLSDWLINGTQKYVNKKFFQTLYDPPAPVRNGMRRQMDKEFSTLIIKFTFNYDNPGSNFRPFIKLLNFISGKWKFKNTHVQVQGDFIPNRNTDGKMQLLFWENSEYTRNQVNDLWAQLKPFA